MNHLPARLAALTATAAAVALIVSGCSAGGGSTQSSSSKTLVVDNTFDLKTSDPARAFELTGSIVDKALYETALTFEGSDVTKPVPQLTTYTMSDDNKTITLTLNGKHVFSSGNPVTIDDIVWSYKRVQGIAGNPSFLLTNLSTGKPFAIEKTSDTTMTITDTAANPALPFILPNPSLGVLDEKTLEQHGGTTDKTDSAEQYLNGTSAGSGPYELSSYNATSKVVFKLNPKYVGTKPAFGRVVLNNVTGPSQKTDVQGNQAQLALNLNSQQVSGLESGSIKVAKFTSSNLGYLWLNQNASVSGGVTNQPDFVKAVRHAIDYKSLQTIAGTGSTQPGGMVPSQFLGSLASDENNTTDSAAAKSDLQSSGYKGQTITLSYPTDATLDGVSFADMAQSVQSNLESAGVKVKLNGLPIATLLDSFRAGKLQAGLMYWGPDFPDPSDYVTFSPGEGLGLRAGWTKDMSPSVTKAKEAAIAAQGDARASAYEAWQKAANADGAFVPLLQAARYQVTNGVSGNVPNAIWTVDLATVE
ncbi:ABC transporter substrate-binding protein [Amnibacterium kyonggiense]|uniref:Peptide/nickel transport system substrate-binding protein n=1 Tax=Amnibacterium kyonggiense TaxID=595671 RepID=A0A4R7FEH3_9MICO|nr:ABC transporter substrate-binding protein [Amnibacterium kyonggiense]TDS75763.1 peptide/nickel transport system substrate-binding protein [Amnibacterium kyonggiense]